MSNEKILRIGLGEAVSRLMKLELMRANRLHPFPDEAIKEREMLYMALNEIKIDLGFDCNGDGIPDSVEIFEQSAKSSCCRIIQTKDTRPLREDLERLEVQKGFISQTRPKEEIKKERKQRASRKRKK
jgi:hypothetical protein